MKTKNIYIILAVVVVAFIGFMGYRHFGKTSEMKAHHEDTFNRLTERAKKSPRIGMSDMGRALKRYYAANNSYPEVLDLLYPDYIGSRSFIQDVNWNYRRGDKDFFLSKSVQRDGKTLTASMDSSLKTQLDTGTMVAAVTDRRTPSAGAGKGGAAGTLNLPSATELLTALRVPDFQLEEVEKTEEIRPLSAEPRTVAVDEDVTLSAFAASVSRSHLVWRDAKGNIGFGNIQYPHADRISIAAQNRWLRVERRPVGDRDPETPEGGGMGVKGKEGPDQVTRRFGGQYMAWKNKNGTIGFGNVQFPNPADVAYIYVNGSWEAFEESKPL